MEADIDDFGVKPPPPSDAIRDILNRYPDGQIFKVILNNGSITQQVLTIIIRPGKLDHSLDSFYY